MAKQETPQEKADRLRRNADALRDQIAIAKGNAKKGDIDAANKAEKEAKEAEVEAQKFTAAQAQAAAAALRGSGPGVKVQTAATPQQNLGPMPKVTTASSATTPKLTTTGPDPNAPVLTPEQQKPVLTPDVGTPVLTPEGKATSEKDVFTGEAGGAERKLEEGGGGKKPEPKTEEPEKPEDVKEEELNWRNIGRRAARTTVDKVSEVAGKMVTQVLKAIPKAQDAAWEGVKGTGRLLKTGYHAIRAAAGNEEQRKKRDECWANAKGNFGNMAKSLGGVVNELVGDPVGGVKKLMEGRAKVREDAQAEEKKRDEALSGKALKTSSSDEGSPHAGRMDNVKKGAQKQAVSGSTVTPNEATPTPPGKMTTQSDDAAAKALAASKVDDAAAKAKAAAEAKAAADAAATASTKKGTPTGKAP